MAVSMDTFDGDGCADAVKRGGRPNPTSVANCAPQIHDTIGRAGISDRTKHPLISRSYGTSTASRLSGRCRGSSDR